jgi:hypothetical protein
MEKGLKEREKRKEEAEGGIVRRGKGAAGKIPFCS